MMFKIVIKEIDKLLCNYLGLDRERVKPNSIKIKNNKFIITSTIPFKRHSFQEYWNEFNTTSFKQLHNQDREKLGLAAGKILAKDLTISFKEVSIDKNSSE
ncbi:MAG: hypothetical protein O7C59_09605 [Rickettsia endosymbiont of Ixodes persulcatus]|nr:hypothetical protein [Rickettsia endosymbiont of Ixodes persulcatus]